MTSRDVDLAIDLIAARQHGVVSRAQLLAAGIPERAVDRRFVRRRLLRLHPGIYQVGPVAGRLAREIAAVLACGDSAALAGRSALTIWRMLPPSPSEPTEVLSATWKRSRPGLRILRAHDLRPDEVTLHDGVPTTTPARGLLDLARSGTRREVERALAEGIALRIVTPQEVSGMVARHPTHRGARALRELLANGDPQRSRSELEERVLALLRRARVRGFRMNVPVAGHEVDVWFESERLVLELDGYRFHSSSRAFERDRRRDPDFAAANIRLMRVTWSQAVDRPEELLVKLGRALGPERV